MRFSSHCVEIEERISSFKFSSKDIRGVIGTDLSHVFGAWCNQLSRDWFMLLDSSVHLSLVYSIVIYPERSQFQVLLSLFCMITENPPVYNQSRIKCPLFSQKNLMIIGTPHHTKKTKTVKMENIPGEPHNHRTRPL
jgi:hypothetical protein